MSPVRIFHFNLPKSMENPLANQQIFQQHYIIGFRCCLKDGNEAPKAFSCYNFCDQVIKGNNFSIYIW